MCKSLFLQPLKELLKQKFFRGGIAVARSSLSNLLIRVPSFEGKIGGARRLDVGSESRYDEG
jgi:hypothetical protein